MAHVVAREGEPIERLLKRFQNAINKDGVLKELKKREYYIPKSLKKRLKKQECVKRYRKNLKKRLAREEKSDR
jgi:small subunit ribosomal protein S21